MVRACCKIVGTCHLMLQKLLKTIVNGQAFWSYKILINKDLFQLFWYILQHIIFAMKVLIKGNIRVYVGRVSIC